MYQSKRRKIVSKIVTLGMVVMLFASMGMMGASAFTIPERYDFSFNGGGLRYTNTRTKDTSSSMYMYCADQSQNYTYRAWAQGGRGPESMVDCDGGVWQYTFSKGSSYNILNLVRENGYSYARIAARPANSSAYFANGKWSTDI